MLTEVPAYLTTIKSLLRMPEPHIEFVLPWSALADADHEYKKYVSWRSSHRPGLEALHRAADGRVSNHWQHIDQILSDVRHEESIWPDKEDSEWRRGLAVGPRRLKFDSSIPDDGVVLPESLKDQLNRRIYEIEAEYFHQPVIISYRGGSLT